MAAAISAISADRLLFISDEGMEKMAQQGTIATLLPERRFDFPYAPARKMIERGSTVAPAPTDLSGFTGKAYKPSSRSPVRV